MGTIGEKTVRLVSGDNLVIRSALPGDAAALLEYVPALLGESEFFLLERDEFRLTIQEERAWVQRHTDQPGSLAVLALVGGEIVGSASSEGGTRRRVAHVTTLGMGVRERWRGKGIGTALLKTVINWAVDNPALEKLCLDVLASNTQAIKLYREMGFVEEGRSRRAVKYGPGSYADEIRMARFVVGPE